MNYHYNRDRYSEPLLIFNITEEKKEKIREQSLKNMMCNNWHKPEMVVLYNELKTTRYEDLNSRCFGLVPYCQLCSEQMVNNKGLCRYEDETYFVFYCTECLNKKIMSMETNEVLVEDEFYL